MAHAVIRDIHARGKLPVLCGGTGLYIQAVTEHLNYTQGEIARDALDGTWQQLHEIDPAAAAKIHPNDQKRISHALALYESTGVTLTEQNARSREKPSPYRAKMILLNARERQVLYDRIDARVDLMLTRGLLEEAKSKRQEAGATSAQAIGHKELEPYFRDECSLEEVVARLKQETRRYAKRQLSWFRRMAREWNEREPGSCTELFIDEDQDRSIVDQAIKFTEGIS
jgi:tRNA dimethylallyltransferase